MKPEVKMSLQEFMKEHRKLVKVLKSGTKKEQDAMAKMQLAELKKYRKK